MPIPEFVNEADPSQKRGWPHHLGIFNRLKHILFLTLAVVFFSALGTDSWYKHRR